MMRFAWLLGLLMAWGSGVSAEEHQRIANTSAVQHRWDIGLDASVTPLGLSGWDLIWTVQAGYEWDKTWSLGLSVPATPEAWGYPGVDVGWSGGDPDLRWNWEGGIGFEGGTTAVGLQMVQDPVILGFSVGLSWPTGTREVGGFGSLSFMEVLNNTSTWSLVLSPRMFWIESFPVWTLNVVWSVGWFQGPLSLSTGVTSGSVAPWSWSGSAGWSWEGEKNP